MLEIIDNAPLLDTTINSAMPYENYGDYYALYAGLYMNQSIYRSLIQFDLPNLSRSGIIESAEIMLYIIRNDYPSYPKEFRIYRLAEKFDEDTVHYWNQPSMDTTLYKTLTISDEINTWLKIDITDFFNEWICKKYPNYGILIRAADENTNSLIGFYSKDAKEILYKPKLQINFQRKVQKLQNAILTDAESNVMTPDAYYHRGNQYFTRENYLQAYEYYKKSFESFNPKSGYSPKLLYRMVTSLDKLEKYNEAFDMIDQGITYYPDFTELMFMKADLYHKQKKFSLSLKEYEKCIKLGDSPLHLNYMIGVGSFKAYYALAEIYLELDDFDEAYQYCLKALKSDPNFTDPLYMIAEILIQKEKDDYDIQNKLESLLGSNLDEKDYMTIADIFMKQHRYDVAYQYILKAEKFMFDTFKLFYMKGICLLNLKEYEKSYESFNKVLESELYEKAIGNMILCEILNNHMDHAAELLNRIRNPENTHKRMVYYALKNLLENKTSEPVNIAKEESKTCLDCIFDVLGILLRASAPEIFEKSLQLLNLEENDEVLLRLAKLYFNHKLYDMAYQEFLRSIKHFDRIDHEGLHMMTKAYLNITSTS
ncbi:MAG: DNRLRE domain-containing protein [Bacillota bacterium]